MYFVWHLIFKGVFIDPKYYILVHENILIVCRRICKIYPIVCFREIYEKINTFSSMLKNILINVVAIVSNYPAITCSKSTIETLGKVLKYGENGNKDFRTTTLTTVFVFLLLTLKISPTFLKCFYCWLRACICLLGWYRCWFLNHKFW